MTIDITKLAREAGLPSSDLYTPNLDRFATLHRAAVVQELMHGVSDEPTGYYDPVEGCVYADGKLEPRDVTERSLPLYTAEQVAGEVAKKEAEWSEFHNTMAAGFEDVQVGLMKSVKLLMERVEGLQQENFKLAAGHCIIDGAKGLTADDGGTPYCAMQKEVEQLRVQLAGCGVAALQNTESSKEQRAKRGDYGYSESYADVCRAVDREIELRTQNAKLRDALEKLARLGNGDQYGNSVGNEIARQALKEVGQ